MYFCYIYQVQQHKKLCGEVRVRATHTYFFLLIFKWSAFARFLYFFLRTILFSGGRGIYLEFCAVCCSCYVHFWFYGRGRGFSEASCRCGRLPQQQQAKHTNCLGSKKLRKKEKQQQQLRLELWIFIYFCRIFYSRFGSYVKCPGRLNGQVQWSRHVVDMKFA